jgi:arsenate reductase (glutaredoxin)
MERALVYHNPVCSKSRGALEILRERGIDAEVIEYQKTPLDRATLGRVLTLLGGPPADLVRKDTRFAELGLRPQGLHDTRPGRDRAARAPGADAAPGGRPRRARGDRATLRARAGAPRRGVSHSPRSTRGVTARWNPFQGCGARACTGSGQG